jgi:hypothetical protein
MSSDTRARINARKAERTAKTPEVSRPVAASKDTKRWCRGKVGREHQPKCFVRESSGGEWRDLRCASCGKILDTWWPPSLVAPFWQRPKPAWVDK